MTNAEYLIYAAGDMKSGWQDRLRALLPSRIVMLDPRSHGLEDPAAYTKWDLGAVRDCHVVVAYMGSHNPSGYGLSLECGFAHALGRSIIFVDELGADWRSPYFGMLRAVSRVVPTMEDAAAGLLALLPPISPCPCGGTGRVPDEGTLPEYGSFFMSCPNCAAGRGGAA